MLLSQTPVLSTLTQEEKVQLVEECVSKGQTIVSELSDVYSVSATMLLAVRCLYSFDENFIAIVANSAELQDFIT
jgi:hypothetical protein